MAFTHFFFIPRCFIWFLASRTIFSVTITDYFLYIEAIIFVYKFLYRGTFFILLKICCVIKYWKCLCRQKKICYTIFTKAIWSGGNLVKSGITLIYKLGSFRLLIWSQYTKEKTTCFPILCCLVVVEMTS